MAEYSRIIYEPGPVARMIFNRPKWHNALSHPMYAEVEDAFNKFARDDKSKVLVVSGAGDCFSGGHDAIGVGTSPEAAPVLDDGAPPEELVKRFGSERAVWREYWIQHNWYIDDMHVEKITPCPKPTIAMVHGYAIYGGMGMANCMDVIFATEDALFLPAGVGQRSGINWRRAIEMAYEHRFFTGQEGYELGFVNRVFPTFDVMEKETMAYAGRVAEQPLTLLMNLKEQLLTQRGLANTFNRRPGLNAYIGGHGVPEGERNPQRYEGRGMARTPRALAGLKAKLESEGKTVPDNVRDALIRAGARDPEAAWARDLQASWRDPESRARAERERQAWHERVAREKAEREAQEQKK